MPRLGDLFRNGTGVVVAVSAALAACSLTALDGFSSEGDTQAEAGGGSEGGSDSEIPSDASDVGRDGGDGDGGVSPSTVYRGVVLADMPISYYRFEETAGTIASDETGAHPGAYELAPTLGEPGVAGSRAILLPVDSNAHVRIATNAFRFPGNAPFAIELWMKPHVGNQVYQWVLSTEAVPDPRKGWSIWADTNNKLQYEPHGGTRFGSPLTNTSLANGVFHHVVATYNGAQVVGYVDGLQDSSILSEGTTPDEGGDLILGCRAIGTSYDSCLDGWVVDELAIYDHVLAAKQVAAHYAAGRVGN